MFETVEEIREGKKLDAAMQLLCQLYPERSAETVREQVGIMLAQPSWRLVGIFDGDECVATMFLEVGFRMYCGRYIRMDSMVIDTERRGGGLGKVLMDWVRKEGKRLGCVHLMLDSYVYNHAGHRFFFREGAQISGYHFTLSLAE